MFIQRRNVVKTASKVFIIISIVYSMICLVAGTVLSILVTIYSNQLTANGFSAGSLLIYTALLSILAAASSMLGFSAIRKLEEARSHKELVTIGVLTMIFCSFLGGLFMLLIKDEELKQTMSRKVIPQSYSVRNFETFEETDTSDDEKDEYTSKKIENNTTPHVENVTNCVYCGEELNDDDLFCGKCGKPTRNVCPECDNVNNPQDVYCRNCGHKLK